MKDSILVKFEEPKLPKKWDYDTSVKRTKSDVLKWGNVSVELAEELGKARKVLSLSASDAAKIMHGTFDPRRHTWTKYCEDIGSSRRSVNRWLVRFYGRKVLPRPKISPPKGKYSCVVIDPPWQVEKILRDVRPKQRDFDYATMSVEEITKLSIKKLAHDDCHLYLWTTHKYLPSAFDIVEAWGFKYQCLMTWVKNVGMTPFSWMYSTEHVLFCVKGSLPLLRKGVRLDFQARVREHSRKPDEFYEIVKKASPSPRIDMFSREKHKGFEQWGDELGKFSTVR